MPKFLVIGDLHFGEHGNSSTFNANVLDFVDWAVALAKENEADKIIQLGDWFHDRHKVDTETLNTGIEGARRFSEAFGKENVFVLEGNHDLYYLNRLDVSSLRSLGQLVTVIDKPTALGNCMMSPWVVSDEQWDQIVDAGASHDFLFAHLELSGFRVNEAYTMEHGRSPKELREYGAVISGHYHSLQCDENIIYTGTPYPITMNEANEDHGVFIVDSDTLEIEFIPYTDINVLSIKMEDLGDMLDDIVKLDPNKTSIRIEFPEDLEDESVITEVIDVLSSMNFYNVKSKYLGNKAKEILEQGCDIDLEYIEDIDAAVVNHLKNSHTVKGVNTELLVAVYEKVRNGETEW